MATGMETITTYKHHTYSTRSASYYVLFQHSCDELIFEFKNFHNHGLATLTVDIDGIGIVSSRVSAGFDDLLKSST